MRYQRDQKTACLQAASMAIALTGLAHAQSVDPITQCRTTSPDQTSQILCLESALAKALNLRIDTTADISAPIASTQNVDANSVEPAAPAPAAPPAPQQATLVEAAPQPTGLGADQLLAREKLKQPKEKRARGHEAEFGRIESFTYTKSGKLVFTLENGQVWRQTTKSSAPFRLSKKRSYTAKIKKGALSGYRLVITELNRSIQVERLQ